VIEMNANGESMKMVYTVVDRGPGKTFWTRVGVGFVNRDGSINLRLDAIPTNGTLQIRDYEERDGAPRTQDGQQAPASIPRSRPSDGLASTAGPSRGRSDAQGGLA
jgi:hypothetical protein